MAGRTVVGKKWLRAWRVVATGIAAAGLVASTAGVVAPGKALAATQPDPQPVPEILVPNGDPLLPAEADVRSEVAPGEVVEIGVASGEAASGLTISTVTAVGPDQALEVIAVAAAEPDTLAVGLPHTIVPFGSVAAAPAVVDAVPAETAPMAIDPYRPEGLKLPYHYNQYAPDMLCTDSIAKNSSRYGCPSYSWQYATGAGQVVAVLDMGVDTTHPDLAAAMTTGAQCLPGTSDRCATVPQVAPTNRSDHGTHVAGIVGAVTGNGLGVSGMASGVRIMPVEVIGPEGQGTTTWLARGIDWAVDNGATVINMSLGTLGTPSDPVLQVAVAHAIYLNIPLIAAVGNDGPTSNRISYPAAYPDVIGVGNVDWLKGIATTSTRGDWVDVVAPGSDVMSTLNVGSPEWGRYGWGNGTSMAAPHVAAMMAMLRQRQPNMNVAELTNLIYSTAQDLGTAGWDNAFGYGLIRPVTALQKPVKAPVTPSIGSTFHPIPPARVFDTRAGTPAPIQPREAREVDVGQELGTRKQILPPGAVAIAYNLTISSPPLAGHLRVMPGDTAYTSASAINVASGQSIANGLVVKIDQNLQIRVYNSVGQPVHVIVDVLGFFLPANMTNPLVAPAGGTGSRFTPITPTRVHDSDKAAGGRLAPGETRTIPVHVGIDGKKNVIPAGTSAIAYNVTVVEPGSGGHLRVMPGDVVETGSSAINWANPKDKIANGLVVGVSADRTIRVFNSASTPVRILIDIVGYYSDSGSLFFPVSPARLYDSRQPKPLPGAVPPATERAIYAGDGRDATGTVTTANVVPSGSTAIAYNITVPLAGTTPGGHLRLWPDGVARPDASVINWPAGTGATRANGLAVGVSTLRWVRTYNGSSAPNHVIIDALGYYR